VVDAKVVVAETGGGAHLNLAVLGSKEKFHIINKAEKGGGVLRLEIGVGLADNFGPAHISDQGGEVLPGGAAGLCIG